MSDERVGKREWGKISDNFFSRRRISRFSFRPALSLSFSGCFSLSLSEDIHRASTVRVCVYCPLLCKHYNDRARSLNKEAFKLAHTPSRWFQSQGKGRRKKWREGSRPELVFSSGRSLRTKGLLASFEVEAVVCLCVCTNWGLKSARCRKRERTVTVVHGQIVGLLY